MRTILFVICCIAIVMSLVLIAAIFHARGKQRVLEAEYEDKYAATKLMIEQMGREKEGKHE